MQILRQKKIKGIFILIKFLVALSLFSCTSCSSLSKSQIINSKKTEAISVLELKILYNEIEEKRNSGLIGECHLVFGSDNGSVKFSNNDDYSFYVIKTKPGIVKIKALKCSNWIVYFKNRHLNLGELEFNAKPDHINYLGNLVINYEPRGFGFLDIIGLGGIINDSNASFDIKIYDNTEKSVNFLKEFYPELRYRNVLKSMIHQHKNTKAKLQDLETRQKNKVTNDNDDKSFKQENFQNNLDQQNFSKIPEKPKDQLINSDPVPNYPAQNNSPISTPVIIPIIPIIPAKIIPNNTSNSTPETSNSISIQSDVSGEQINKDAVNNERKIGRIIRRNKALRENNNVEQPVNNQPISNPGVNESFNPRTRFRPSEVQ
jgi:hypothetical protein